MSHTQIRVGIFSDIWKNEVCNEIIDGKRNVVSITCVSPLLGNRVSINTKDNHMLNFCEVEVWGKLEPTNNASATPNTAMLRNVAKNGTAFSSTYWEHEAWYPMKAVDGYKIDREYNHCFHANYINNIFHKT